MHTITVGAYEAKTNLARLLAKVAKGDEVIITKHESPWPGFPRSKLDRA